MNEKFFINDIHINDLRVYILESYFPFLSTPWSLKKAGPKHQ